MNLLGSYTFSWWQMGIVKLSILSIGILIGGYFADTLMEFKTLFFIIAIVGSVYSICVTMKQMGKK